MLHALLEMEDNDKVPEGGVTSGEDVVSAALALMSDFPAWHMSLGDEKCDILQSAIEDRVEHGSKKDASANDGAHVDRTWAAPSYTSSLVVTWGFRRFVLCNRFQC